MSDSEQGGVPLIEPAFDGSKKRKRDGPEARKATKKNRRNKRPNYIQEDDLDEELGINLSVGRMDANLAVNMLARRVQTFEPDLTTVEADELTLPASAVLDTSDWSLSRTVGNLAEFIRSFAPDDEKLEETSSEFGSPHTLVIAASGIRAVDLTRALRSFQAKKGGKVAKLFAKHIKLADARNMCRTTRISVGVGTPQRLLELLESEPPNIRGRKQKTKAPNTKALETEALETEAPKTEAPETEALGIDVPKTDAPKTQALKTDNLKRIVVDASFIDDKKRGIADMRDLALPLIKLLTCPKIRETYEKADVKVWFY